MSRPTMHLVRILESNSTGLIGLNRPKALNCLNQDMVDAISDALESWRDDSSIHRVVIYSTSPKAFCAGADVRAACQAAASGNIDEADRFFRDEYALDLELASFPKPIVAAIGGYAMGGGLGLSMHGSHRVVTEKAQASMPEMAIGFCPDVGSTWVFPRMSSAAFTSNQAMANFLCTTGWRMDAADLLYTGLGTDFVAAGDLDAFVDMVVAESLDEALEFYTGPRPTGSRLKAYADDIEATFGFSHFSQISHALEHHGNREFVDEVSRLFAAANPTSQVAAVELIAVNLKESSLKAAIDNEFVVGAHLRRQPNFAEGVRAVLVDKDHHPSFSPSDASEVDQGFYRDLIS